MSVFEIDASGVKDPIEQRWDDHTPLDVAPGGKPLYSAKRSCTLTFNALSTSEFSAWQSADNAASHSVKIYNPALTTATTYTGVYIRVTNAGKGVGGYIYGAEVIITNITA